MSDPRAATLVIEQGVTNQLWFSVFDTDGALIDFTAHGYIAAKLQIRTAHLSEGGDLLLTLSTDNGGIVLGAFADGSGYLLIEAAVAKELTPWGEAVYDLLAIHESGRVDPVYYGVAVLRPVVTEA